MKVVTYIAPTNEDELRKPKAATRKQLAYIERRSGGLTADELAPLYCPGDAGYVTVDQVAIIRKALNAKEKKKREKRAKANRSR